MTGICDSIDYLQTNVARMIECVKTDPAQPEVALSRFFENQDALFWPKELKEHLFELIETTDLADFAKNVHAAVKHYYPRVTFVEGGAAKCDWPEYERLVTAGRQFDLSEQEISWIHPIEIDGEKYILIGEEHYRERFRKLSRVCLELGKQGKAICFGEGTPRSIECEQVRLQLVRDNDGIDIEGVRYYGLEEEGVQAVVNSLIFLKYISRAVEIKAGKALPAPAPGDKPAMLFEVIERFLKELYSYPEYGEVFFRLGEMKKVPRTCLALYEAISTAGGTIDDKLRQVQTFSLQNFRDLFQALALFNYVENMRLFSPEEQTAIKKVISKPCDDALFAEFEKLVMFEKRNRIFARHLLSPPIKFPAGTVTRIAQMGFQHLEGVIREMRLEVAKKQTAAPLRTHVEEKKRV